MKWRINQRIGLLAVASVLVASFTWLHAQQRSGARQRLLPMTSAALS